MSDTIHKDNVEVDENTSHSKSLDKSKQKPSPEYIAAISRADNQLLMESTWTKEDLDNAIEEKRYVINPRTGRPYRDVQWTVNTTGEHDVIQIENYKFSRDRFFRNPRFRSKLESFYESRNLEFRMKPIYPRNQKRDSNKRVPAQKWIMSFRF